MDRLIALLALRYKSELRSLLWAKERVLSVILALPGLLLSSLFLAAFAYVALRGLARSQPQLLLPAVGGVVTLIGLLWAAAPLLSGIALVESHDLSRLLHFPVPLRTLVASSLIANFAQPMVLAQLPPLVAAALALAPTPLRGALSLAGFLVSLVFILATAQAAGLALHGLARNRRFYDRALFLGLALSFLISAAPIALMMTGSRALSAAREVASVLAWSPFAWGARAAVHASRGEAVWFAGMLALGVLATLGAVAVSAALIGRVYRGELDLGGVAAEGSGSRTTMRFEGPLGALLEKDLRSAWRDPALRASVFMGFLGPLLVLFFLSRTAFGRGGGAILWLAMFIGLGAFGSNALGFERRGLALLLGFPVPRWRLLVGKNLLALFLRTPGFLTLLAAAWFAPPAYAPPAFTVAAATFLMAAGTDNLFSILFPVAAPAPGKNPYGHASGARGLGAAVASGLFLMGTLALAAPFALLAWLPLGFQAVWLGLLAWPLALLGAAAVYAMLVAWAASLLERREPELLERVLAEA